MELLTQPFVQTAILTAFVLVGIHSYLGFHIVTRGVIFVDLSLAQAAALGSAAAWIMGYPAESTLNYIISLLSTLIGAVIISLARTRDDRVPQEAFIGIVFAFFSSGTILFLAKQPEGTGVLNHLLSGSLFTISSYELFKITALYSGVGLLHWMFREKFFLISVDRGEAVRRGWAVLWWDILFYALFGLVVTSSVSVAGVMLVFALLVIPPTTALLIARKEIRRLALGWTFGIVGVIVGLVLSLKFDLPAGPVIVVSMTSLLGIIALVRHFRTLISK